MAVPKIPKFLKNTWTWVLIGFIAFAFYASQKKFITPVKPDEKAVQFDAIGIKPQAAPKGQDQGVLTWAENTAKDIMTFNAENGPDHFQQAVDSYFTRQWKLKNNGKLAPDEVLQHVKDDCRSESLELRGNATVASYGTQGDSEMWTIHIPATIVDAPFTQGSCMTMDDQKHPIDVIIALLIQKDASNGMKIADWKMGPSGNSAQ